MTGERVAHVLFIVIGAGGIVFGLVPLGPPRRRKVGAVIGGAFLLVVSILSLMGRWHPIVIRP